MSGQLDGMALLFGENNGAVLPAQERKPEQIDGMSLLFGGAPAAVQAPKAPAAQQGSIFDRPMDAVRGAWTAIKGKHDSAYADVPAFDRTPESQKAPSRLMVGMLGNSDDAAIGDIISKTLGDRLLRRFKDANGYDLVEYRGDDGKPVTAYVNKPGLDASDVMRSVLGAAPQVGVLGGLGKVMRGASSLYRVPAMTGAAGSTSVLGDIAAMGVGSEQGVDQKKALLSAGTAGAFEALPAKVLMPAIGAATGAAVAGEGNRIEGGAGGAAAGVALNALARRALGMNPASYIGKNGALTRQGEAAAAEAGAAPGALTPEQAQVFAETYAATRDAAQSMIKAKAATGIPLTKGQATRDPAQMVREDQMRWSHYGDEARGVINEFDKRQEQAILDAVYTGDKSIASLLNKNPGRLRQELAGDIRTGLVGMHDLAKQGEKNAWAGTRNIMASSEAREMLPAQINGELKALGIGIDDSAVSATPAARNMLNYLRDFRSGKTAAAADDFVPTMAQDIEQVRKNLLRYKQDAATPTDRAVSDALYRGYNSWVGAAAEAGHFPREAVMAIRAGRQWTAEVNGLLNPSNNKPVANNIRGLLEKSDSPEGVISTLFGKVGPSVELTQGATQTLRNLKVALARYAPETGKQTWDDIRLAYWQRLVTDGKGELATPTMIVNNIKTSQAKQGSAWTELFDAGEIRLINGVRDEIERAAWRPPPSRTNASNSAMSGGVMVKELLLKAAEALGLNTTVGRMTVGVAAGPFVRQYNRSAVRDAVDQAVKPVVPSLGKWGGALGAALNQDRQ